VFAVVERGMESTPLVRSPDVLWRRTLDGVVLLPPSAPSPIHVVGAGWPIWQLLAEPIPRDELIDTIVSLYDDRPPGLEADLSHVIDQLTEVGAIQSE
jgi:hypothetical protein